MSSIVVGFDGSTQAERALTWAVEEARLRDADLAVVHAYRPPHEVRYPASLATATADEAAWAAATWLEGIVGDADTSGVRVTTRARPGGPVPVLCHAAKGADLLVVGSRGQGGLTELLLGSVSHQLASHAPCPVAIIRPVGRSRGHRSRPADG
jgi:nucleotide-binding universal stress UspA family protein